MRYVTIAGFLALLAPALAAQTAPALAAEDRTVRPNAREIQLDIRVTDKDGRAIGGLQIKDFSLWEGGKQQTILSLADVSPGRDHRKIGFFFDDSTLPAQLQIDTRRAVAALAEGWVSQGGSAAAWSMNELLETRQLLDLTGDADRFRASIEASAPGKSAPDDFATLDWRRRIQAGNVPKIRYLIPALQLAIGVLAHADSLARVPPPRHLVLFTGNRSVSSNDALRMSPFVVDPCNQAGITIYAISGSGYFIDLLTEGTGGLRYPITSPLSTTLAGVAGDLDEYYRVTYLRPESAGSGCKPLRVKVDRPGVKVRFQKERCVE